ncbi:Hypothetical protein FKW44_021526, partial [Caligus rogercresseyi]
MSAKPQEKPPDDISSFNEKNRHPSLTINNSDGNLNGKRGRYADILKRIVCRVAKKT